MLFFKYTLFGGIIKMKNLIKTLTGIILLSTIGFSSVKSQSLPVPSLSKFDDVTQYKQISDKSLSGGFYRQFTPYLSSLSLRKDFDEDGNGIFEKTVVTDVNFEDTYNFDNSTGDLMRFEHHDLEEDIFTIRINQDAKSSTIYFDNFNVIKYLDISVDADFNGVVESSTIYYPGEKIQLNKRFDNLTGNCLYSKETPISDDFKLLVSSDLELDGFDNLSFEKTSKDEIIDVQPLSEKSFSEIPYTSLEKHFIDDAKQLVNQVDSLINEGDYYVKEYVSKDKSFVQYADIYNSSGEIMLTKVYEKNSYPRARTIKYFHSGRNIATAIAFDSTPSDSKKELDKVMVFNPKQEVIAVFNYVQK